MSYAVVGNSGRTSMGLILSLLIAALGVLATGVEVAAQGTTPVTFTKDIAPILQRSCQTDLRHFEK